MESFNPTPEWLGDGLNNSWAVLEVWGWPLLIGAGVLTWAVPTMGSSWSDMRKAEYETFSPMESNVQEARVRAQEKLRQDAEAAEVIRKRKAEELRKIRLEELKSGPKSRKKATGLSASDNLQGSSGLRGGPKRTVINRPSCPPSG